MPSIPALASPCAEEERDKASVLRHVGGRRAHVEVAVDEDHVRAVVDYDLARLDAFFAFGLRVRLSDHELFAKQANGSVDLFEPDLRRERRRAGVGRLPPAGRDGEADHDLVVVRLRCGSPAGDKRGGHDGAHHSFQHRRPPSRSHVDCIAAGSARRAGRESGSQRLKVGLPRRCINRGPNDPKDTMLGRSGGGTPRVTGRAFRPCPAPPTTHREWPRTPA